MRLAVYLDYVHVRDQGVVYAPRAFSRFVTGLRGGFDRLVVAGRVDPERGTSHYPLPGDVDFVAMPYYASAAGGGVLRALLRSLRRWNATLDGVDVAWVLGPQGLAVPLAVLALARRKRVVLGVRQDLVAYTRSRHPGRPLVQLAARGLDAAFRALGRLTPAIVVGPALAARYGSGRETLELAVSMVSAAEIVDPADGGGDRPGGTLRVLSVGRLEQEKNPLLLADVLAELHRTDPRWRLVVCGEGPLEPALRERLELLGVAGAAELLGYLPQEGALRDAYRGADAFLHVSWTEGLPQVLFEAFAAALPVVATAVGSVAEVARDAALLVGPGDPVAPAEQLRRIAADPDLRRTLVTAGHRIVERHTLEAEQERVVRFLRSSAG